ncbi:MAG TPA: hypothetical protein VH183_02490 [Burkholderiaceae bacterium]|jgi:hypothetical protein|nr:hypothetical protein [Burkholderiaceae bacterium]
MSLLGTLRGLLSSKKEEEIARKLSLQALDGFEVVHRQAPALGGEPLYERILSTRLGVDGAVARELVESARETYAEWPVTRAVRFRDVVLYLIVDRCLKGQAPDSEHWIHGEIRPIVRSIIPQNL